MLNPYSTSPDTVGPHGYHHHTTSFHRLEGHQVLTTTIEDLAQLTLTEPHSDVPIRSDDGYYTVDDRKLLSVTNILELGIPKPALMHWAAWEVARCAMQWLGRLIRAHGEEERHQATKWLQKAAERRRDAAGDLGTAIHRAAEAHILGAPVPEPTEEQAPFLVAFERFCDRWQPRWEATEMVLANFTDGWAGTCDAWAWITLPDSGPEPVLIVLDFKTGRNVYPEAALQLSAYSRAEVGFLRDGTRVTPPRAVHGVVVHLRPDKYTKGYAVKRVDIGDETYEAFLNAQRTAEGWVRGRSKSVISRAYQEPAERKVP